MWEYFLGSQWNAQRGASPLMFLLWFHPSKWGAFPVFIRWSPWPREELIVITDSEKTAVFCCRLILRNSWRILWRVGSMVANVCSSSVKQISIRHDRSQYCTGSWTWFVQMSLPYDSYNKTYCTSWLRCSATLERRRSPTFPEDHRENQTWCSTFRWIAPKKNDLQKPKISLVSLECSRQVRTKKFTWQRIILADLPLLTLICSYVPGFGPYSLPSPHLPRKGDARGWSPEWTTRAPATGCLGANRLSCWADFAKSLDVTPLPPVSLLGWMQFLIFTHFGFISGVNFNLTARVA